MERDMLRSNAPGRFRVAGRFFPAAAGAPTYATLDAHLDWSVVWVSTGKFRLTIKGVRQARLMALMGPTLQITTPADTKVNYGDIVAATGTTDMTVDILAYDPNTGANTGAVVDIAANANNSISFELEFSTMRAPQT